MRPRACITTVVLVTASLLGETVVAPADCEHFERRGGASSSDQTCSECVVIDHRAHLQD
jgi:hypothetical protein